jgi:predicted nucleotidyltransferase
MKRDTALAIIKANEPELKALGVVSVSLFGSTARDEAADGSDVDVAVRLENVPGGFTYFGRLGDIKRRLTDILSTRVDVIAEPAPRPQIQQEIDRDRCLAF